MLLPRRYVGSDRADRGAARERSSTAQPRLQLKGPARPTRILAVDLGKTAVAAMLRPCAAGRLLPARAAAARRSGQLYGRRPVSWSHRRGHAAHSIPVLSAQLVVESKCELGESPVWCTKTGTLFFVDCLGHGTPKLWAYRPRESELAVSNVDPNLCSAIGSIGLVAGGGFIMASDCGVQLLRLVPLDVRSDLQRTLSPPDRWRF